MRFVPDTILLNNVFLPFYVPYEKIHLDITQLELIPNNNGLNSIINLNIINSRGITESIVPYIEFENWDKDTKDWFWYDDDGYKYRKSLNNEGGRTWLEFYPIWGLGTSKTIEYDPVLKFDSDRNNDIGIYFETDDETTRKFYKGTSIAVLINEEPLKDITNYEITEGTSELNFSNTEANKQFYYDFSLNRIITNQNLDGHDPKDVKIYLYKTNNSLSVKARLASNAEGQSYYTPVVDYYIVKLNGQDIK